MINTLIVDDEESARTALTIMLTEYCRDVTITGIASSAIEGLKLIHERSPDLVFLDVEMPLGSGFDLLELSKDKNFKIIFTTAHEQYALKAIKHDASDYLLKPVDVDELITAVGKIGKQLLEPGVPRKKNNFRLRLNSQKETVLISPDEIIYIEADGRYSTVHLLSGKKCVVSRNIGEFEDELITQCFYRLHKSYLVNLAHVQGLVKDDGSHARMSNGDLLLISRTRKKQLVEILRGK